MAIRELDYSALRPDERAEWDRDVSNLYTTTGYYSRHANRHPTQADLDDWVTRRRSLRGKIREMLVQRRVRR